MSSFTVSVIVPNYNHDQFLEQRIESILYQTFQDFELIILDDFSTDNSIDIIRKYENHSKISNIILNKTNSGSTFLQWEKGIRIAKGKYIWIAESDDYNAPTFLENLVSILRSDESLALAYCKSKIVDEKNNPTTFLNYSSFPNGEIDSFFLTNNKINGDSFISKFMFRQNAIPNASSVVFKKINDITDLLVVASKMKLFGDWYFWTALVNNVDLYYCSEELNFFRTHPNTVRNSRAHLKSTFFEQLGLYVYFKSIFPKNKQQILDLALYKFSIIKKKQSLTILERINTHQKLYLIDKLYFIKFVKSSLKQS